MTIGGVSLCLVIKPEIYCIVEIGVVNYDILPPVVWPIWMGGKENGSSRLSLKAVRAVENPTYICKWIYTPCTYIVVKYWVNFEKAV